MYRMVLKRCFDWLGATVLIGLLCLPMLIVAGLVLLLLGRPIFFRQERPGRDGRPFVLWKFRTMTTLPAQDGNSAPAQDGDRLTRCGRFLRATSLDELPELFNVLRGDMSLVGPRPLLMEYLELYTPQQARRHEIRPGITGWAQVHGRNATTWKRRLELDVWYVDHLSFWRDLQIIARTVLQVITCHGVRAEGHATMPKLGESLTETQ
jgi:sugar transferase EpsL